MVPLTPWWPKLELKIWPHLAESIESEIIEGFSCSRCLNDHINLRNMIGSFASGASTSIVTKNLTKNLSQPFKKLRKFLVQFLASREGVAPLESDPIIWGRSIRSFRHLEHQNLSQNS